MSVEKLYRGNPPSEKRSQGKDRCVAESGGREGAGVLSYMPCGESRDPGKLEKMKKSPEGSFLGFTQVKGQVRAHIVWKRDQNILGLRFPADWFPAEKICTVILGFMDSFVIESRGQEHRLTAWFSPGSGVD